MTAAPQPAQSVAIQLQEKGPASSCCHVYLPSPDAKSGESN